MKKLVEAVNFFAIFLKNNWYDGLFRILDGTGT